MKTGIDYFPKYCMDTEEEELVEAKFGLTGYALLMHLYQRIFGGEGYYCLWNSEVALLFAKKTGLGPEQTAFLEDLIQSALRWGIFHQGMYEKYGVLTSAKIQRDFFFAAKRRKELGIRWELMLENNGMAKAKCIGAPPQDGKEEENDDMMSTEGIQQEEESILEDDSFIQRKEEKTKQEKRKRNKGGADRLKTVYGVYGHVTLLEDEKQRLEEEFGEEMTKKCIAFLDEYVEDKGYRHKNSFLTIRRWVADAVKKQEGGLKPNRFQNYQNRQWDFDAIEKLERERVKKISQDTFLPKELVGEAGQ
ncbi:MAG: DUF4373 domain-containing protein [Clostridiales bacterium]|nr:DUF4373 domain-containing protein [Clostridiales bacterium]